LAWGLLLPEKFALLTSWSIYVNSSELCLIEGDFYDDLPELKLLPGSNPELAACIADHMRKKPSTRITGLNGIYSGLYIDRNRTCAYIFGDLTGTRPVFWLSEPQRLVVTGNIWAFRGCDGFSRSWDKMALAEMLTIGFPMAGRTWLKGVKQLQRGRQVCSLADGRTTERMLVNPVVRQSWSIKQSVAALRAGMDETISRIHRRLDHPVGLGLSGGLDSRLLLASLHTQNLDHRSFTFCESPDEADNRVAQSVAKIVGKHHNTLTLDRAVTATARDFRLINEGESPGYGFLLLAAYAQQETKSLLIGYPGDLYAGAPCGPFRPLAIKNRHELADCMLRNYMTFLTPDQAYKLVSSCNRVTWQDVLDEWYGSFERIEQQSLMDVYLDHMTDYRVQRRTRPRIESARWFCVPIYPYMDERLYSTYRSLPLAHLDAERAHLELLCDYKTGVENLPSASRAFARFPIYKEYQYRHLIHWGRVARRRLVSPVRQTWHVTKGALGLGQNILNARNEAELQRLEQCQLFHWPEVRNLIERAKLGTFANRDAIVYLINASVIDEFLFGPGLSGDRRLRFLEPLREIQFVHTNGSRHSEMNSKAAKSVSLKQRTDLATK
jgi:hypothetical protein